MKNYQNIKIFSRFCEVDFLRGPIAAGSNGRSSVQPRWAKLSAINSTNIQMMTMMVRRWRMAKVLLSNKTCKNSECSLFLVEQYQHKQKFAKLWKCKNKEIVDKNVCDSCNKHFGINCEILATNETNFKKKYCRKYLQKLWAMWHLARRHSFPLPDS